MRGEGGWVVDLHLLLYVCIVQVSYDTYIFVFETRKKKKERKKRKKR